MEILTYILLLNHATHFGKTPPCADALIRAGVKKVFIAMLDPNPLVSGSGVRALQDNGIEVEVGLLEVEANEINRGFVKRMTEWFAFCNIKNCNEP